MESRRRLVSPRTESKAPLPVTWLRPSAMLAQSKAETETTSCAMTETAVWSGPCLMYCAPERPRSAQRHGARAQALLEDKRSEIGFNRIITDSHIAKISVVGVGMKSHAGVAATMFRSLADRGINIQAITTSEIKVSVMIDEDETELAVRVLHTAYGLDAMDEPTA